jgi:hypothetical protein
MLGKKIPKILLVLLLVACTEEEHVPKGTQLLVNPNMSMFPDSVSPWRANRSEAEGMGASRDVFLTGNRSLYIQNPDSVYILSGSWGQTYSGPLPAPGSRLELTAFLKGEGIKNSEPLQPTFYFYLQASTSSDGDSQVWYPDPGISSLEGDFDWIPVKIILESLPVEAKNIGVTFIMPYRTSGKIYLDEITLTVE